MYHCSITIIHSLWTTSNKHWHIYTKKIVFMAHVSHINLHNGSGGYQKRVWHMGGHARPGVDDCQKTWSWKSAHYIQRLFSNFVGMMAILVMWPSFQVKHFCIPKLYFHVQFSEEQIFEKHGNQPQTVMQAQGHPLSLNTAEMSSGELAVNQGQITCMFLGCC